MKPSAFFPTCPSTGPRAPSGKAVDVTLTASALQALRCEAGDSALQRAAPTVHKRSAQRLHARTRMCVRVSRRVRVSLREARGSCACAWHGAGRAFADGSSLSTGTAYSTPS